MNSAQKNSAQKNNVCVGMLLLVTCVAFAATAFADVGLPSEEAFRETLRQAEEALGAGEPQIAESHFRAAQLQGWDLLGLLAMAEGDLDKARDAFERSSFSAVVGVQSPRLHLALTLGQLGEHDEALHRLRALTETFSRDVRAWEALVTALVAQDRAEEARRRIGDLRASYPDIADGLDPLLAAVPSDGFAFDPGPLAGQSPEQRAALAEAVARDVGRAESEIAKLEAPADFRAVLDAVRESYVEAANSLAKGDFVIAEYWLRQAHEQGRVSPESEELLRVLKMDRKRSAAALLQLAMIAERGQPKFQITLLDQAMELAPNSEAVLAAHARTHVRGKLWAPALRSLEPLAGIFPENAEYAHLHGQVLLRLGQMTDAVEALQRAVALDPQLPGAALDLGNAMNQEKRFADAQPHLTALLERDPENLDVQAALAETEEGLGELEAARQRAVRVLASRPDHATAHLVLGMVHMKSRRFDEARDALQAAVNADPGLAKAHYQLSLAYARLGKRGMARNALAIYEDKAEGNKAQLMTVVSDSASVSGPVSHGQPQVMTASGDQPPLGKQSQVMTASMSGSTAPDDPPSGGQESKAMTEMKPEDGSTEEAPAEKAPRDLSDAEVAALQEKLAAADRAFTQAAAERDRIAIRDLLAGDATFLENVAHRGKTDFLKMMEPLFEAKYGFAMEAEHLQAHVARSGEIGWTVGTSTTSFTRPGLDEVEAVSNHYLSVWTRNFAGDWVISVYSTLIAHPELGQAREARTGLMTGWKQLADQIDAAIKLDWTPERTVRAASGELAYTYGQYQISFEAPSEATDREDYSGGGDYVVIWQKDEENGRWHVAAEGYSAPQIF